MGDFGIYFGVIIQVFFISSKGGYYDDIEEF